MCKRKIFSLLIAMVLLCINGCSYPESTEESSSETSVVEKPMEIRIGFWNIQDYLKGDPLQTYVEEKFNVKFIPVNITYDNYNSVLQELAVSDNLPDIFTHDIMGTSAYENWIQEGKIRSVPKDLSAYPNLETYLDQPYTQRFRHSDGFFYAIPRMTYPNEELWALDRCVLLRKDWMQNLGLSEPQSWEEFVDLLHAFVYEDPDGNGIDDTQGLATVNLYTLEVLYLSIFPELSNTERGWIYEDNQWMPVYNSKRTGAALQKIQQLYREGLLSSNFAYGRNEARQDFVDGKVGAICMQYYAMLKYMNEQDKLDQAHDIIMVMRPWPAEDGKRYRFTTSLHWSESYFGNNVDDEKMTRILEIYDWLLSDEFNTIWSYGLEGIDWEYQNGKIVSLDQEGMSNGQSAPLIKYPSMNIFAYLTDWNQENQYENTPANRILYGEENILYAQKLLKWYASETSRVNYNFDVVFMSTPAKNNLTSNQEAQKEMAKAIMSDRDAVEVWEESLAELQARNNLPLVIEEVTQKAEELGLEP